MPTDLQVGGWPANGQAAVFFAYPAFGAEEPVMPEPRDHMPADLGRAHLRACHADREQVIGVLKAAFVQGRLGKDELNARVGQALAARTNADLATLTADLPAGL